MNDATARHYFGLIVAVAIMSGAAILIRLAFAAGPDTPAVVVSAWRMGLAALILVPWVAIRRRGSMKIPSGDRRWILLSGLALAVHFWTWIQSLELTSVASSVVLVTTSPIWVGLGSWWLLRERPGRLLFVGIAIAFAGGVVIGIGGQHAGEAGTLTGDLYAICGALSASAYLLLGRKVRTRIETDVYISWVYLTAAILLIATSLLSGASLFGWSHEAYWWMAAIAIGPQLIGHSTINWVLGHIAAGTVAVMILFEPIGSALLARIVLGEELTAYSAAGGALILVGVYCAIRSERRKRNLVQGECQT